MRSPSGHGLSPHIIPTSISRWHLFYQFIFCCALRAFLSLSLRLCRSANYSFFVNWFEWKFHHLGCRSEWCIKNDGFFRQQCQFILHSPFLPEKMRVGCRFIPEGVYSERCIYGHQQCVAMHIIPHVPGWLECMSSINAARTALGIAFFSSIHTHPYYSPIHRA